MDIWAKHTAEMKTAALATLNVRVLKSRFVPVAGDNGHIVLADGHVLSVNRATVDWEHLVRTVTLWTLRSRGEFA